MSDFIVSARKYRPTTFDSVVGQSSITLTLKNGIKSNQLAQSFLFCGPRGVGKTSCARILAKIINCEDISDNIESCNKCVSCKSFNNNTSFNVHELDAASNNSVDDIRNLVDQVRFAPQVGAYNIYIIDEVHMLSNSAFNAFLKTLEEPPKHAKFILATTEKNKIIPTILSRCQIFDFKRVKVDDITKHLSFVAKGEKIEVEPEALHLIAQKADGAMRDALSLFDRLISFSHNLSYKSVINHLNILDYDYYFKITDALLNNDIRSLLIIFNEILENGFDSHNFVNGLANHLRDLLVSKDEGTIPLLEKADSLECRYLEQSKKCELDFLLSALDLCNDCDVQYRTTHNQRLLVELTLMRISSFQFGRDEKKKSKSFAVSIDDREHAISVDIVAEKSKKSEKLVLKDEENLVLKDDKNDANNELGFLAKKKSSMISINSSFNEFQEVGPEDTSLKNIREVIFSEDQLLKEWGGLIIFIKDKGKSNLGIALSLYTPKLLEGNLIELPVSNAAQVEIVLEEKYIILDYLRNKLQNDMIEIVTKIVRGEKSSMAYSNKDKFKKMLDDNPALEVLRINLGLDPDY